MANPEARSAVQVATKSDLANFHALDDREGLISADFHNAVFEAEHPDGTQPGGSPTQSPVEQSR